MFTRGLRNNNPGNIRRGSSWKGLSSVQSDKFFCQFSSMEYGIRAFFVLMHTYKYKHKLSTLSDVLHRFAPLSENNTDAYIAHCCKFIRENGYQGCYIDDQTHVNFWFNSKNPSKLLRVFADDTHNIYHKEQIKYKDYSP